MTAYPNVPNLPGVPSIPRDPFAQVTTPDLLTSDSSSVGVASQDPQWGLYKDGSPVIVADSVVSLDYMQEWRVADFPLEGGKFESYDKVATPFESRILFSTGGTEDDRTAFLQAVDDVAGTSDVVNTTLYDVVMPEKVYPNVSVTHYDFSRKADNGVGLLKVLLHCRQVRVTTAPAFSNTKSPSAAATVSNGTEAPHAPTSTQNAAVGVGDQAATVGAWKVQ